MTYRNYEWFLEQDLSEHAGKWLAIVDRRIIASGSDAKKVIEEARSICPGKRPFITKIRNRLSIMRSGCHVACV